MPKCPFCDSLLVQGAEQEYMDKLHRVRRDMEDLKQIPEETVKQELKNQGRRIYRIHTDIMRVVCPPEYQDMESILEALVESLEYFIEKARSCQEKMDEALQEMGELRFVGDMICEKLKIEE